MKKVIVLLIISASFSFNIQGQTTYQPTWESIDSRPVAQWFGDAKFGIFIHWGPYSVPAWSPKGTYSEWYQRWMQGRNLFGNGDFKGDEVTRYHEKTYGPHFSYYEFGDMFKADLFEPDDWADLFEESGAKYIMLTTKHHDGFTLWPSKEANDRGFAWNSVDIGPKRDLVGELTTAVKKTDVKMGFYYSLYEWYHPWWQNDKERFVSEHFHPQFKDLVEKYQPDALWGDGEWDMEAEKWKTPELLAWLFNESSVKDNVVINDRWGKGIRKKHGGYFTTEYESEAPEFTKPWEECRGMGFSFGYNQNEDVQDYNSPKTLTLMLVNIVSTGGNLLLDIGPDSRGRIPVIMQERLKQIGAWLKINGEAIYKTKPWNKSFQWSIKGKQDYKPKQHYLGGDFILKQTIDPEPGYGVKELFFTRNESAYYAISPKWPGKSFTIRKFKPSKKAKVTLLATGEALQWRMEGRNMIIDMPAFNPNRVTEEDYYAWAFKITK
ncbi:alpha-L-fucosidase [Flavivirga spongiicola]|uniref:alpha-L-fucosidase n=1 Tax=Flavivirga spongiicola TaxID=421621 RepID=A0ABU7XPK7_9FLAO|nr:alpha-L-fucosidase [Flavivirga sp. MEBiC05379]MDO5977373.1 alpha-L-fucosidase [Flavivirga sp. MEBiC05379]